MDTLAILAIVMSLLLFVPAGTVHYWQACVYLSIFFGASALTTVYLTRKDPALLEYADRDVFKVRIFPIEPHSRKRVKLSYTQVLKADSGLIGYTYPLNTEKFSARPVKSVSIKVELTSDRPLKSIYSPSHAVEVKRHGSARATVGFEANDTHPDTDFTLYFAPEKDELGVNLVAHKVSGEDGYFLLLVSPGVDAQDKKIMPKDVAFVLDTSGSMAGKKLEQAKKALQFCVENLNVGDRFEIIRFSTEVGGVEELGAIGRGEDRSLGRRQTGGAVKRARPPGGAAQARSPVGRMEFPTARRGLREGWRTWLNRAEPAAMRKPQSDMEAPLENYAAVARAQATVASRGERAEPLTRAP